MPNPTPARWRTSSYCGASNTCVALASAPAGVSIRDQADPASPALNLTHAAFAALISAITMHATCPNCRGHATVHAADNRAGGGATWWRCGCGHRWITRR